jgi:hypothetical protein
MRALAFARVKAVNADLEARNALLELQNTRMRRALYGQRTPPIAGSFSAQADRHRSTGELPLLRIGSARSPPR